jgi:hypothetical protein
MQMHLLTTSHWMLLLPSTLVLATFVLRTVVLVASTASRIRKSDCF